MKKIEQTVETKDSIDLQMEVSMEGETIIKRQADSLVGNFMRLLYVMMLDKSSDNDGKRILVRNDTSSHTPGSVDFTSSAYIDNLDNNMYWGSGQLVYLDTDYQAMTGFYYMVGDYDVEVYEVTFDRSAGSITQGSRTDWSSLDSSKFSGNIKLTEFRYEVPKRSERLFKSANILIGRNDSSSSSNIEDQWLENENRRINRTGTSITEPAVQTNSSEITLSRQFTNNENYDITVGEIGVICQTSSGNYVLIARDNVTDFTIAQGNSVTIEYKFTIDNSGDGGMMSQFHQLFYRHLRDTGRTVRDVFNNDKNDSSDNGTMVPLSLGGVSKPTPWNDGLKGEYIGPIPGTGTATVANTNTSLESRVPHGTSDGTMVHYGPIGENVVLDEGNGEIYFDVVKPLENRGSTTITVQEQALYSAYYRAYDQEYPQYSVMIARHVLNNSVDVAPGEILKTSYRLKLTV